ncbi:hypothetical protein [Rugamonas sp.]|uniref:hypothetical protein n=1 Tax=Rugamonas sp. TaxID=1926287 RepID=UPI0025FC1A73|nr:hypothetical protein [Rugamonas sp.]
MSKPAIGTPSSTPPPEPKQKTTIIDQIVHLVLNVLFFLVIAGAAVGLDLLSTWIATLGVTSFTVEALQFTAHGLLIFDLVLFCVSLLASGLHYVKGI